MDQFDVQCMLFASGLKAIDLYSTAVDPAHTEKKGSRVYRLVWGRVGARGGGGQLDFKHARMCVSKSEANGSFFRNKGMK